MVEVSDVMAQEGVTPPPERECCLELAAERQRRTTAWDRQQERPRGITA